MSERAGIVLCPRHGRLHGKTLAPFMSWALDEFFASVEDEFGVRIASDDREALATPGDVIDFLMESSHVAEEMDEDARREHLDSVLGELMAQTLGVTRYREDSRFEDLGVR